MQSIVIVWKHSDIYNEMEASHKKGEYKMGHESVRVSLDCGGTVLLQPVSAQIIRVRLDSDGTGHFRESTMHRYDILNKDWPTIAFRVDEFETEETVVLRTDCCELSVDKRDGRITFREYSGRLLLQQTAAPISSGKRGFAAAFRLEKEEKLYGLGDESRFGLQKRGHRAKMWVKNVECYSPNPFLMSSKGWGFFLNSTWRHFFDLGQTNEDSWKVFAKRGELDYYLIAGDGYGQLLDRFTDLTGKPQLLPLWAYGLTFVCNQQASARDMLDDAMHFRREGIPCDMIGLEPGWMDKNYDYSVHKKWHPDRFYVPPWAPSGPQTFIGALERLGFKLSLWLCCDYDVTYHEEKLASETDGKERQSEAADGDFHPDDFEQDLRAHAPVYMDQLTKRDEPWFRHLSGFVDQGVKAFKMDGARQVNEHPDRRWGNGMDDEELHNLYPTLLNKQMHNGFKEATGLRPMIYTSGGYAGIQRYAATWAGDTGGGPKPLISMLNHGLSGHVNTSCDMDVFTAEGIHFGFLQPWSQVNSWAYWRHPWLLGDRLLPVFKFYAKLRYRLLPYIYSAAHVAARTAMPIIRAMPLAAPDDPESDRLVQQYMLGDSLLVGAFTKEVHLPKGGWIDYWSGKRYMGPLDVAVDVPENRGGPLFVKAGAIVPMWPDMDYVGQKPLDEISLLIYPGDAGEWVLYEDDGQTERYLSGEVAMTRIGCRPAGGETVLRIGLRQGRYAGMPARRRYDLSMLGVAKPAGIVVNGSAHAEWQYERGVVRLKLEEDPERQTDLEVRFAWQTI